MIITGTQDAFDRSSVIFEMIVKRSFLGVSVPSFQKSQRELDLSSYSMLFS